ncbi:MAG: aminotransferase class I/II-fold pyridoxal phosphate-dependent enzyme [Treponema sp.]|nr:aminotransferase class I/II-fold pyridoxal phosphate-dependent enzyme [Treponema sp.]
MSLYWNRRARGLSPYVPGEQPRDRKFIKLNTNENPYPPSPKVAEAIAAVLAGGAGRLRLYPDPACTTLREAVARRYGARPEQVFAGNGSDEVLAFAFGAFFEGAESSGPGPSAASGEPGAEPLLFPDITYSFYPVYAELWDIPFRPVPLAEDFSVNAADYCVPSGGVILPNPNAPTGRALAVRELRSILAYQLERRRVVVIDEAYAAFGAASGTESLVPFINEYPNLLTVHTLSKSASLAGLRVGFAVGNEELIEGLCRVRDSFNSYTVDRLALPGAAAALSDAAYYDGINRRVIATRERVSAALAALGFTVIPSAANFVFARSPNMDGADFSARLRDRGILVRHFDRPRIGGFVRISIGTDEEMDALLAECKGLA